MGYYQINKLKGKIKRKTNGTGRKSNLQKEKESELPIGKLQSRKMPESFSLPEHKLKGLRADKLKKAHYDIIAQLSQFGLSINEIINYFDFSLEDAEEVLSNEAIKKAFERGRIRGTIAIASMAFQKAAKGDNEMIKFWLKSVGKWSETFVHEIHAKVDENKQKTIQVIMEDEDLREKALELSEQVAHIRSQEDIDLN